MKEIKVEKVIEIIENEIEVYKAVIKLAESEESKEKYSNKMMALYDLITIFESVRDYED